MKDRVFTDQYYINRDEIQSLPEVAFGELRVRAPKPLPKLGRVATSRTIEDWAKVQLFSGTPKIVRKSYDFFVDGDMHSTAWVGGPDNDHFLVCDHVFEFQPGSPDYEARLFSCQAVQAAINHRAKEAWELLRNDHYLARKADVETIISMTSFLLEYISAHRETWIGSHKGGVALIGGLAQTFRKSYGETKELLEQMETNGHVSIGGVHDQVVTLAA
ncbi:hypothetical protein HY380_00875 [Candidatus Saccharibacteria bacterium]|nr:hypothetical protein [Candidatus Saccharibacteria bacterium]